MEPLANVITKSFSGYIWPQIQSIFPEQIPIERTTTNSWDDKNFLAAIEKTGRKKLVFAGLWTEICVAFPTIQAIYDGYEVNVDWRFSASRRAAGERGSAHEGRHPHPISWLM
jgi:nicotinamidase-related amidase